MKKKIIIILLFIFFALPIPVALLGTLFTFVWFLSSLMNGAMLVEILSAFVGVIVGFTYIFTYIFSMHKTLKENKISVKTFLPVIHCLAALLYLLSLSPTQEYINNSTKRFGFAKKDFTIVEEYDTHGGLLGDGKYYLVLDCSENKEKALKNLKDWNKLPMSKNIYVYLYGIEPDEVTFYNYTQRTEIPMVTNGYYMFLDKRNNSHDDSEFRHRHSYNFIIAVYDCDTDKMYYYELDT